MSWRRGIALLASLLLILTTGAVAGAAPPSTEQPDLVTHLDTGYIEEVTEHLVSIGSVPSGFRVIGTPQDRETAEYLAAEMRLLGLEGVAVEEMTADGWLFEGASVTIDGPGRTRTFEAASLGGVPGTGPDGVSGDIVPVGFGTKAEFDAVDVEGKIAFAWWDYDNYFIWPNYISYEAGAHGATAVIIASAPQHAWYSAGGGRALGSNDAECDLRLCVPMVTISKHDGKNLNAYMKNGPVAGNVTLNAGNLLDATGYQAIGMIPGSVEPDKAIVFTAHHDAWFTSAADDSVGVAMMMAVAKAVMDSGYEPHYTWVFAPVTGEEYGLANSYYDWLQGAFWRITRSHTEWQTDAVAVLNWEVHSPRYFLAADVPWEMYSFLDESLGASAASGLIGGYALSEIFAWNDGFTYSAEGAPAITFAAADDFYWWRYHTDYDSIETLDFPGLWPILAAETRVALDLDQGAAAYGFDERIANLAAHLDTATMAAYGIDSDAVDAAFAELAVAWDSARGASTTCLREATRVSLDEFTALTVFDENAYVHDQAQRDVVMLDAALVALDAADLEGALGAILGVGMGELIPYLSSESYAIELEHHDPDYEKISWGIQGQLPQPIDLYEVWYGLAAGTVAPADAGLELTPLLAAAVADYQARVGELVQTMNKLAAELDAATVCTD